MPGFRITGDDGTMLEVESESQAARVLPLSRGDGRMVSCISGSIAAGLAANATVFDMRHSPTAGSIRAFIERIRVQFTTTTAFTTPVTAGRQIRLYRGSGATPTGGTQLSGTPWSKNSQVVASSWFNTAQGGDVRIATTGALTTTGVTFETDPLGIMPLSHVGAGGGNYERNWEMPNGFCGPLILSAGELIAIRNGPNAMDAAGVWQIQVEVEWHEAEGYV